MDLKLQIMDVKLSFNSRKNKLDNIYCAFFYKSPTFKSLFHDSYDAYFEFAKEDVLTIERY